MAQILGDPTVLRAWRDAFLYRLLMRASRAEAAETLARINRRGHADITLTDTNLLSNLDTEGTTISALARRGGVTRQAAGQQLTALERAGYVERRPDPTDGRAVLIGQTKKGQLLLRDAIEVVSALEAEYAEHLGTDRLAALKDSLAALVEHTDPQGALGKD
jgi:DNA-binding MarR family transcriptional regulator